MDKFPRHLVGVLRVQEVLKTRGAAEASGNGPLARAVVKMVREQTKKRKDDKDVDTSSDSDTERKKFNSSKCMKEDRLGGLPQVHTPSVRKTEPMAKRAAAGQKRRGKYPVPGQVTEYTPN